MGWYTTLFTATDSELSMFFPGWRFPLAARTSLAAKNPFTGEDMTVYNWDPGRTNTPEEMPAINDAYQRPFVPPIMPPDGEYQNYQQSMEENAPALLRTLPHVAVKNFSSFELEQLGEVILGKDVPPARFVDCADGYIGAMQAEAIPHLASASEQQLREYALKTCEGNEFDRVDGQMWVLQRVRALAQDAVSRNANVFSYLLCE
jgi:hypothetical protein